MTKIIILFIIITCLIACSNEPYRVVQMENGIYKVQQHHGSPFSFYWTTYCSAWKCYEFKTKEEACVACDELIKQHIAYQKSVTIKEAIKCQ